MKRLCLSLTLLWILFFTLTACDNGGTGSTPPKALSSPARVATVGSDALVVTDYTENRFCFVDKSTLSVTTCLPTKGQPTGIAYADYDGGRFYVGNKSVRSVDMFDAGGNFLGHLGGSIGLFDRVNDLVYDPFGQQVYVLDSERKEVRVFELNGDDSGVSFGASELNRPTALAIVPDTGEILVSDFGDPGSFIDPCPQVRVFDNNGNLDSSRAILGNLGGGGMLGSCDGTGQFSAPQGITVDSGHNIYVVDAISSKVLVFNLDTGRDVPLKTLGSMGFEVGELFYPLDVIIDETSRDVFVADNRNGRITVFTGGGVLP